MPPILALTLCTIFVMWLLTLDHKSYPGNSVALWLPTLWFLIIAGKSLGAWFPGPRGEGEIGSPLDRYFIITLIILGLIILFYRKFPFFKAIKDNAWLMVVAAFTLLSVLWSDIFVTSFQRWVREIATAVIMSFLILSEKNPREAVLSILRRTAYIGLPFSVLLIKYYPGLGVQYHRWTGEIMWVGITSQKNGLGILCLVAFFFLIWSLIRRGRNHNISTVRYQTLAEIVLLVVSLYLLKGASVQAMSATSVGSLAGGLTLFIVLLRLRKFGTFPSSIFILVITIAVIVIGTLIVFKQGEGIDFVASSMGRDSTLTGRTDIWREFLPMAMKRPLLGHGFGGFWTDERFRLEWVNSVHNGYLEVILHLGFVGLVLVSLFLLSCCQRAREIMTDDFYWGSFWVCFLLMSIVHNIGESSCDSFSRTLTAIIVFFCVASSSMIKGSEKVKADRTIER